MGTLKWPKPTHIAVVAWGDAYSDLDDDDDYKPSRPFYRISAGWLAQDDEKGVLLISDWNEDGSIQGKNFIVRGMVVWMHKYKVKRGPRGPKFEEIAEALGF